MFYNVPIDQLLPVDVPDFGVETQTTIDLTEVPARRPAKSVTIDLARLDALSGPESEMLNRYLQMVQVQRQDFNGRVLTIRRDDLQAIAAILGTVIEGAVPRLEELGLCYLPPQG